MVLCTLFLPVLQVPIAHQCYSWRLLAEHERRNEGVDQSVLSTVRTITQSSSYSRQTLARLTPYTTTRELAAFRPPGSRTTTWPCAACSAHLLPPRPYSLPDYPPLNLLSTRVHLLEPCVRSYPFRSRHICTWLGQSDISDVSSTKRL